MLKHGCRTAEPNPSRILFLALCATMISGFFALAQSPPAQTFDVVSIKLNRSINSGSSLGDAIPGKFTNRNYSLRDVMEYAFDIKPGQVAGLPSWADSDRYDIDAKMDDAAAAQEKALPYDQRIQLTRTRVQALLADRFGLRLHHQTKNMPVLALMVAKEGAKLTEEAAPHMPGLPPGSLMMNMSGTQWVIRSNQAALSNLVNALSMQPEITGRILVDRTALNGQYTFTLQWQRLNLSAAPGTSSDSSGPSLFTALEQQLGLRLEAKREPVDVLVVDRVERPSPN